MTELRQSADADHGVETIDRIIANEDRTENLRVLDDLCELMLDGSLCALGGLTPYPVLSALQHFPDDFTKPAEPLPNGAHHQENASWR